MDYMPNKRAERYLWWKNLVLKLDVEGPKIGLTPAEITAAKAVAEAVVAKMEATDDADTALKGARAEEKDVLAANEPEMRFLIRGWKAKPQYAGSGVEGTLQLKGPESTFDPNTFVPTLRLSIAGNQVKLDFTKGECDSVAVYARLRGEVGWVRLGLDSSSPYYDTRPLTVAGAAETREYHVIGVIDDVEVGQQSAIMSIVFGGAPAV